MEADHLRLMITPEFRRRYLADADRVEQAAVRCGAHHDSNVRRIMAEMGMYRLVGERGPEYVYCEVA